MQNQQSVSVIIPNWNGKDLIEKNIQGILEARLNPRNMISEIIVVDDASSDGSAELIKEKFGHTVRLIRHKENRGFSSAVNTGIRAAKGWLVCLLNTDVIPSINFLENLLPFFRDKKVFAISLHERGYGPSLGIFENGFIAHRPGKEENIVKNTFWVSGGSGIFRKDLWIKVGWMDEGLLSPFYWEDVDICYRALKRGYKLLWDPKALVIHKHESTINISNFSPKRLNLIKERNQLLFIWKNLTSRRMFRKHIAGILKRVFSHPGYLLVVSLAVLRVRRLISAREKEKREAKLSDEAIFAKFK